MKGLTTERAAIALLEQMGLYGHPAASQFIGDILAALKTARQEALREGMTLAAEEADMHVCDDPRFCHCSSRIYKAILDRLTSKGG